MLFSSSGFTQENLGKLVITDHGPCILHSELSCYDELGQNIRWEKDYYSHARFIVESNNFLLVTFNDHIIVFNTFTSELIWQSEFNLKTNESFFEPVIDSKAIYLTTNQGALYKLTIDTGKPIWQTQLSQHWIYPPATQADLLVVGGKEHRLWGIHKSSGETVWEIKLQSEMVYRPIKIKDHAIVFSTFARDLYKIDARTGKQIWHQTLPSPAIYLEAYDDQFLVGDYSGTASLLSTESGKIIWKKIVSQSPIYWFNNNSTTIAFTNEIGQSTTLALDDGKTIQFDDVNHRLNSAPVFNDNSLVFFPSGNLDHPARLKPTRVVLAQ